MAEEGRRERKEGLVRKRKLGKTKKKTREGRKGKEVNWKEENKRKHKDGRRKGKHDHKNVRKKKGKNIRRGRKEERKEGYDKR